MRNKKPREPRESSLASGWVVEGENAAGEDPASLTGDVHAVTGYEQAAEVEDSGMPEPEGTAANRQLPTGMLVMLGVLGGVYLIYTWVWFSWAKFYVTYMGASLALTSGSFGSVLQLVLYWAAVFAPALWFIATLQLNRGAANWKTGLWLLIGAVVLVPLPYFVWGV